MNPRYLLATLTIAVSAALPPPAAHAVVYHWTTLAGSGVGQGYADGIGLLAHFNGPVDVCVDAAGNRYIADSHNQTIRKATPAGVVTTLAGSRGQKGSADGAGTAARFNGPTAIAVDGGGSLYVADIVNDTIRKISPDGMVTTFAGSAGLSGSEDGQGNAARFDGPVGIELDRAGNLYVSERGNQLIRKITPAGVVSTLAGMARKRDYVDATGSAARFYDPSDLTVDASGMIYVVDSGNGAIRKVTPAGVVTTVKSGVGYAGAVAVDAGGNVYYSNEAIFKITPSGTVSMLAGGSDPFPPFADGTGSAARFSIPWGLTFNADGNLLVADSDNHCIRQVTPSGVVTTILGGREPVAATVDGRGLAARFNYPRGAAFDANGNLFVADWFTNVIRRVTPQGEVSTFAGKAGHSGAEDGTGDSARFSSPTGVAVDAAGNVYVSDSNKLIRKITANGEVSTLVGLPFTAGTQDSPPGVGLLDRPNGIAVTPAGNVFFLDNGAVRSAGPGRVTTLRTAAVSADSRGIALNAAGNIYLADRADHTIKRLSGGVITTVAGSSGVPGWEDGDAGTARFNVPFGLCFDNAGNLYICDAGNSLIRKMTPAGEVTTIGGLPYAQDPDFHIADGTGSVARFSGPNAIAATPDGNLYVTDGTNHRIVLGRPLTPLMAWKLDELGDADVADLADPDADGMVNLVEYALVQPPAISGSPPVPVIANYPDGDRLRLLVSSDPERNDVSVVVEAADVPAGPWTTLATSVAGAPFTGPGYVGGDNAAPGLRQVEIRDAEILSGNLRRFLRVRVFH